MAYCQALVKLEKGFPLGVHILEDSTYVLVFSCFRSRSISPHLLHITALGGTVCWHGCVSKRDNASWQGFADEGQGVFPEKSCEPGDFRDGTAGFCVLGSGLVSGVFPPQRGSLLSVPHSFFSRMDVKSDRRCFLLFRCECIHFKGPFSCSQFEIKFEVSSCYQIARLAFYSHS